MGLLVMMVVFGMSVVGCGGGGTFTLTNIPTNYNGMYAFLDGDKPRGIIGAKKINIEDGSVSSTSILTKISNGKVEIPLWVVRDSGNVENYSGNDKGEIEVWIIDSETYDSSKRKFCVTFDGSVIFSNGKAIKSFHEADYSRDF